MTPKLVPKTDPEEAAAVDAVPKPPKLGVPVAPLVPKPNAVPVLEGVPKVNPPTDDGWLEVPNSDMIVL